MYLLQSRFKFGDLFHEVDFGVTSTNDFLVFVFNLVFVNQYCILVVSCDWQLWNLHLSLLEVYNDLIVVLQLFEAVSRLLVCSKGKLVLLLDFASKSFQVEYVIFQFLDIVLQLGSVFFHFDPVVSFLHKSVKVFLSETEGVISFVVVHLPVFFLCDLFLHPLLVDLLEWVKLYNAAHQFLLLL